MRTHYLHELPFPGRDKVLEVDPGFDFYQADRVSGLQLDFGEENPALTMSLLARAADAAHYTLELRFSGIRELVLPEMKPLLFLPELEFEDVSDRMLEGIRYEVISHYERAFRCTCQTIVIRAFERRAE